MMDNYRDENRTDQKEQEVLLVKENPQPARYSAPDEDKKKRSFGWFRPLLGGVIGGGLALGIYTFTPLGDHQTQDTSNTAPAQETSSVTAKQTSSDSGSSKSANSSSASKAVPIYSDSDQAQIQTQIHRVKMRKRDRVQALFLRKQTAKRISLRITTWSKAPLPLKCHYMTAPM